MTERTIVPSPRPPVKSTSLHAPTTYYSNCTVTGVRLVDHNGSDNAEHCSTLHLLDIYTILKSDRIEIVRVILSL